MWCLELDDGMRLCVDQGLVPGQSATLDTAFSFQFLTQILTTFKDLEPALLRKIVFFDPNIIFTFRVLFK